MAAQTAGAGLGDEQYRRAQLASLRQLILDCVSRFLASRNGGLLRLQSAGRGETIADSSSREVTMHARVSSYQASDPERLVEGFRSVRTR